MDQNGTLSFLIDKLKQTFNIKDDHLLWYAVRGAINPSLLISNIAETLMIPSEDTEQLLIENGFGDLVAQKKLSITKDSESSGKYRDYTISLERETISPFKDFFSIEFSPSLNMPIRLPLSQYEAVSLVINSVVKSVNNDAFLSLYRRNVGKYYNDFMASDAKLIDSYIADQFKEGYPKYIINSGIGANEQFSHFIADINNADPNRKIIWLIIDSPQHLKKLPPDATITNTLFMEFSRSGKTEETIKIHEYTPRKAKRIVFANSGPLRDIGIRDNNLLLELPDQVSGRFGRNKTPILLAPMHVAKMDTKKFWQKIEEAIAKFDLAVPDNLPMQIASFIYLYQKVNRINHIYLGCNDEVLATSADELLQFWNEGVNKNGNDISISRYFGLLRDSHLNIEGILGNYKTKMGIFLLREKMRPNQLPPMTSEEIDPINADHAGLSFGDEERILAEANYQRFSELMPTLKIVILGDLTIDHAAILGQLWSDLTFCYSRLVNVDPGSNPEVKYVRDRAAKLLAEYASKKKKV